jgi:transglutaminase-like putative cysteine protease
MALLTREMLPETQPEAPSNELFNIPDGTDGIRTTLDFMVRLTREYRTDLTIRKLAEQIVQSVPRKAYMSEAQAIQDWVRNTIRYTQDVYDVEMVKTPLATYFSHSGDCDDMSLLAGVLMNTIGHPVRYVAVGTRTPGEFEHVYPEAKIGRRWVAMETTEDVALGWEPQPQLSRMVRNV